MRKYGIRIIKTVLFLTPFLLGTIGFYIALDEGLLNAMYSAVRLYGLETDCEAEQINLLINFARWTAPIVSATVILTILTQIFGLMQDWFRAGRNETVAIHGDNKFIPAFAASLGKRALISESSGASGKFCCLRRTATCSIKQEVPYDENAVCVWDPDRQLGILSADCTIYLLEPDGTVVSSHVTDRPAASAAFSPDGSTILVLDSMGYLFRFSRDWTLLGKSDYMVDHPNDVRWEFGENGEIRLWMGGEHSTLCIIEPVTWDMQIKTRDEYYAYWNDRLLAPVYVDCQHRLAIFRRYSIEDLISMGQETVEGLRLYNPEQYGLS